MIGERRISQSAAKEVLDVLAAEGGDPEAIAAERSLEMAGGAELEVLTHELEGVVST